MLDRRMPALFVSSSDPDLLVGSLYPGGKVCVVTWQRYCYRLDPRLFKDRFDPHLLRGRIVPPLLVGSGDPDILVAPLYQGSDIVPINIDFCCEVSGNRDRDTVARNRPCLGPKPGLR